MLTPIVIEIRRAGQKPAPTLPNVKKGKSRCLQHY